MKDKVEIGVIGVIFKDSKILLGKRLKADIGHNLWIFPGGSLEEGEELEDCLKRECLEETGLVVRPGNVIYAKRTPSGAARKGVYIAFWAYPDDTEPQACEELGEPKFFTWDEANKLNVGLSTRDILDNIEVSMNVQNNLIY